MRLRKLWRALRRRGWLELMAIIATLIAMLYWLNQQGWSWQAIVGAPLLFVFGYMACSMLYDMWWPRR